MTRRLDEPVETSAGLAWFLLVLGVVFVLATLLYVMLDASFGAVVGTGTAFADGERASEAGRRVRLLWDLWPLWGGLAFLLIGYRRAVNETRRVP